MVVMYGKIVRMCVCVFFFVFRVRCSLSIMFAYHFELLIAKGTLGCQTGVRAIQSSQHIIFVRWKGYRKMGESVRHTTGSEATCHTAQSV